MIIDEHSDEIHFLPETVDRAARELLKRHVRLKARTDGNHKKIVNALRECGASVLDLSRLGKGAPDISVGLHGKNYFLEIKDGSLPPSKRELTEDEEKFQTKWSGHYAVVTSIDEAMLAVGLQSPRNWKDGKQR